MSMAKFSLNIFQKLWLALLVVALVPLVSLWYIGSREAREVLTYNISQNLVGTTNTVAAQVVGWDDTNLRVLSVATKLDDIRTMKTATQHPILKAIFTSYEWLATVITIAPDGANVGRHDERPLLQYGELTHFMQVMSGKPNGRQLLISKTTNKPTMVVSAPIKDGAGQLVGVMAITMNLDLVSKMVASTKIGETGHAMLLDGDYRVIADSRPALVKPLQDMSAHPALSIDGITTRPLSYSGLDGKRVVAFVRKLPQGWTLLVEQDYDEAYAALQVMERNALILIVLSTVLVSLIAYLLGKQLTRPIKQLTAIANELSTGKFDVTIAQTARGDEIGSLARAIERLGISIQLAMDRLRKKA
jgi:methyl-accepting chemotaxis protein